MTGLRVLVTGFYDWQGLNGQLFRLEDNPSGKLAEQGLGELLPDGVEWHFLRLPVVWGTAKLIDYSSYDVVVNVGLESSVREKRIAVEDGAFNMRAGHDVVGAKACGEIVEGAPSLSVRSMSSNVQSVDAATIGSYTVAATPARATNTYICNETHWATLTAVADNRIKAGYFIHIPLHPVSELRPVLAELIGTLVSKSL